MTFQANIAGVAVQLVFAELPKESQDFIINYGLKQYLQDGAAISKVHTTKERNGEAKTEEEKDVERKAGVNARVLKLKAGTVAERATSAKEPADPVEAEMCRIVLERLRAKAKFTGAKLPKGEELTTLVAKNVAAHEEKLRAMAEKNLRERAELEFDLGE